MVTEDDQPKSAQTLQKFDLSKRKVDKFLEEVNDFAVSFDGEKILYRKGESWTTDRRPRLRRCEARRSPDSGR